MDDIRTSKTVNGVTYEFLNLNGRVVHQFWTENGVEHRLDFIYDQQGKPLTLRYKAGDAYYTYYCLTNLQGDVIKLYHAKLVDGKLVTTEVASYTYDAWGNVTNITRTAADTQDIAHLNPIRYRGYYQDIETGFYYLQSRYYDPAIGRFLNADSLAVTGTGFLGYNMFAYCNNNPVSYVDPDGYAPNIFRIISRFLQKLFKRYAAAQRKPQTAGRTPAPVPANANCYAAAMGDGKLGRPGANGNPKIDVPYFAPSSEIDELLAQYAKGVLADFNLLGRSCQQVESSELAEVLQSMDHGNEYLVALRVGSTPLKRGDSLYNDFHFLWYDNAAQTWYGKTSDSAAVVAFPDHNVPLGNEPWPYMGQPYYDSGIIYFVVQRP